MEGASNQGNVSKPSKDIELALLKIQNAHSYLENIKRRQPQLYKEFLDIMKLFLTRRLDKANVIKDVSFLFRENPDLIDGFNTFLPFWYKTVIQPNELARIPIKDANLGGATSSLPQSSTVFPNESQDLEAIDSAKSSESNNWALKSLFSLRKKFEKEHF